MKLEKYLRTKAELFAYRDRKFQGNEEEYINALKDSVTIYVGNLAENVVEERLWAIFGLCGEIKRVIMGVNRSTLYPCGFAFVEFYSNAHAKKACTLNGIRLSGKYIKVDIDYGFREGRQYGRGVFGGQFKDDYMKREKAQEIVPVP